MAVGRYLYVNRKACRAKKGAIERDFVPLKLPIMYLGLRPSLTPQRIESQREAKPLLIKYFPLPLLREGGQGDRLLNNLILYLDTILLLLYAIGTNIWYHISYASRR